MRFFFFEISLTFLGSVTRAIVGRDLASSFNLSRAQAKKVGCQGSHNRGFLNEDSVKLSHDSLEFNKQEKKNKIAFCSGANSIAVSAAIAADNYLPPIIL